MNRKSFLSSGWFTFIITFVLLSIIGILSGRDFAAARFFAVLFLFIIPGWLVSKKTFSNISSENFFHLGFGFIISIFIFLLIACPALYFHFSTVFTLSVFACIYVVFFIFAVAYHAKSIKGAKDRKQSDDSINCSVSAGRYLFSILASLIILCIWILRKLLPAGDGTTHLYILGAAVSVCAISANLIIKKDRNISLKTNGLNAGIFNISGLIVFIVLLAIQLLSQTSSTFISPDHLYYQSNIADFTDSNALNKYEPTFGENFRPFSFYSFPVWDLLVSFLAKTSGAHPFTAFNRYLPLFVIILSYMVIYSLLITLNEKIRKIGFVSLAVYAFLNIFSGLIPLGYFFSILRAANCKSVLMSIFFPMTFLLFIKWLGERNRKNLFALLISATVSTAIHPMAVSLIFLLYAAGMLTIMVKESVGSAIRSIPALMLSALPSLIIMAAIFVRMRSDMYFIKASGVVERTFLPLKMILGPELLLFITITLILFKPVKIAVRELLFVMLALIFLAILIIPGAYLFIFLIMSPPIAVRVLTVPQILLMLSLWAAIPLLNYIHSKRKVFLFFFIAALAILSAAVWFQPKKFSVSANIFHRVPNKFKVNENISGILEYYSRVNPEKEISVIAPLELSGYIPTVHARSRMYISRWFYAYHFLKEEARNRLDLLCILNTPPRGASFSLEDVFKEIRRFGATDVILTKGSPNFVSVNGFLENNGFKTEWQDERYAVLRDMNENVWLSGINLASLYHSENIKASIFAASEKVPAAYAYLYSSEIPQDKWLIDTADFHHRARFIEGWSEIEESKLGRAVRYTENRSIFCLDLTEGKKYTLELLLVPVLKRDNGEMSVSLYVNGRYCSDSAVLPKPNRLQPVRLEIGADITRKGVDHLELRFNFYKKITPIAIMSDYIRQSAMVSRIIIETE